MLANSSSNVSNSSPHCQHPIKKRASLACHQCRLRKVKCDLTEKGPPCSHCHLDQVKCTTSPSKRSRRYRIQRAQRIQAPTPELPLLPRTRSRPDDLSEHRNAENASGAAQESANQPNYEQLSPDSQVSFGEESDTHSAFAQMPFQSARRWLPVASTTPSNTPESISSSMNLPSYIRPPQRSFKREEVEYLERRGALSIPDTALRGQLLLAFMVYVYPFLPVLDLQDFIAAIEGGRGSAVSLLLFQAVMFAGTAFVDQQYLLNAGFENRLAARAYFFEKVKLLYDFGWESDRIVSIQATLLHAWWYVSTSDQKDPWYWLGICISLATGIGLNQASSHTALDAETHRLWRRIWWTIVSRDRTMCLITRKPMRIKDEEIKMPALKFSDFDIRPINTKISLLQASPLIGDCVFKVMLADMFMSKLKILLIGGRVISYSYNLQRFDCSTSEWAMFYTPKKKHDLNQRYQDTLQKELDDWSKALNNYSQMGYVDDDESSGTVLRVHRAALRLLRLMAEEALLRPLTFPSGVPQQIPPEQCALDSSTIKARADVSKVSSEMSVIMKNLRENHLLGFLPPLSVGCILTAVASFLVELRLANKCPFDEPDHEYHDCIRSLLELRGVWPVTEGTCAMLNQMTTNNQIWFARTLTMLAKPVSMASNETLAAGDFPQRGINSVNQERQRGSRQSHIHRSNEAETLQEQSIPVLTELGHNGGNRQRYDILQNSQVSTYLASMYPFPWTAADFNVLDLSTARDLFMDHDLTQYNVGGGIVSDMSGYPSATGQMVEDVTNCWRTG